MKGSDPILTNEELVAKIQAGINVQEYMGLLFEQNRKYIYKIAVHYSSVAEIDDLMQEGYFGLERAVKGYQPEFGTAFISYAGYWIEQAMKRYIQNMGRTKRIPIHVLENISKYQKFRADFQAITGNEPSDDEYCSYLKMSKKQLNSLRKYIYEADAISLDALIPGSEDSSIGDLIPDQYDLEESVIDDIATAEGKQCLWEAVDDLGGRYTEIIKGQFQEGQTLDVQSSKLHISRERVRKLRNKALALLQCDSRVRKSAEIYGYGSPQLYHWSRGRFFNTNSSSTEFIALKHVRMDEVKTAVVTEMQDVKSKTDIIAGHIERDKGHIPIQLQQLQALNQEIEALIKSRKTKAVIPNAKT